MKKPIFSFLQIALCTCAYLSATSDITLAQVTSDNTVNTQVNQNGNVAEITGGETRGDNLFHSFQEFSVGTGNEAFFNNAASIANIFSRVTGDKVSSIDGLIRANGSASLFLINPQGIIFGENARLDLGGSFYGSSASSILFEDGEFSAVDNLDQPILTINAPIGLSFRDEPGNIVNRSRVENSAEEIVGLEVTSGNNLAFIGGNINFEAGEATAKGGNIYLGGLAETGIVELNQDGSLSFPEDLTKADVTLTNGANIDTRGTGGGNITVDAQNLSLAAGEFGSSLIWTGIRSNSTSEEAQAGDITINVAENISLNDSRIINQVDSGGVGNSGNITINTGSLEATNGGDVDASTFGQGNAGAINITATGDITVDGEDSGEFPSGITSLVDTDAVGNAGGVTISTTNLNLTKGGRVSASTFGQGNAGSSRINASGNISADGESSGGSVSGVFSTVGSTAVGTSGGIDITTTDLTLTKGAEVSGSTFGEGNAGLVKINALGNISVDGENSKGFTSGVYSTVDDSAVGNSGGIDITTTDLTLTKGSQIITTTFGQGNAGLLKINASGTISADGENFDGDPSGVFSTVQDTGVGISEGINITTADLTLTNGGRVNASTIGEGNAGLVKINASGNISADGENSKGFISGIFSTVESTAIGTSGGIDITTTDLTLTQGGIVSGSTFGEGNAGLVKINASGNISADGERSNSFPSGVFSTIGSTAVGTSGGIDITTTDLTLTKGAEVSGSTFGEGNAGVVKINALGNISVDGENSEGFTSGVYSTVDDSAVGNSGGIDITTTDLTLTKGSQIITTTFGKGNAGLLKINASGTISADGEDFEGDPSGVFSTVQDTGVVNSEGINITTTDLTLTNGGRVNASTIGQGNAGAVKIEASGTISANGETQAGITSGIFSAVARSAKGNAAGIDINSENLSLTNNARNCSSCWW